MLKISKFFDLNVNLSYAYRYGEKQMNIYFLIKTLKIYQGYSAKLQRFKFKKDLLKTRRQTIYLTILLI